MIMFIIIHFYCETVPIISKHLSTFRNSSSLAKKNCFISIDEVEDIGTRIIPWKNCVASLSQECFISLQNDTNAVITKTLKWGSGCPSLASCKACINCFPFHYYQDSSYRCFSSTAWIKCWRVWQLVQVDRLDRSVEEKYEPAVLSVLFALHAFTGCYCAVCFKRKGKIKYFESMKEKQKFVHNFRLIIGIEFWPIIGSNDLKNLYSVYLVREMFLLSMLSVTKSFNLLANFIVHYHLTKNFTDYTQPVQISRFLFANNAFTSKVILPLQQIMAENFKIRD